MVANYPVESERGGETIDEMFEGFILAGQHAAETALPFGSSLNSDAFMILQATVDMLDEDLKYGPRGLNVGAHMYIGMGKPDYIAINGERTDNHALGQYEYEERYRDMLDGLPARWGCHMMKLVRSHPDKKYAAALSLDAFRYNVKWGVIRQTRSSLERDIGDGAVLVQDLLARDDFYRGKPVRTLEQHCYIRRPPDNAVDVVEGDEWSTFATDLFMPRTPLRPLTYHEWQRLLDSDFALAQEDLLKL